MFGGQAAGPLRDLWRFDLGSFAGTAAWCARLTDTCPAAAARSWFQLESTLTASAGPLQASLFAPAPWGTSPRGEALSFSPWGMLAFGGMEEAVELLRPPQPADAYSPQRTRGLLADTHLLHPLSSAAAAVPVALTQLPELAAVAALRQSTDPALAPDLVPSGPSAREAAAITFALDPAGTPSLYLYGGHDGMVPRDELYALRLAGVDAVTRRQDALRSMRAQCAWRWQPQGSGWAAWASACLAIGPGGASCDWDEVVARAWCAWADQRAASVL